MMLVMLVMAQVQFFTPSGQKVNGPVTNVMCGTNMTCSAPNKWTTRLDASGSSSGGIDGGACSAGQYVSAISTTGVPTCGTPPYYDGGTVAEATHSGSTVMFDTDPTGCSYDGTSQVVKDIDKYGNATCGSITTASITGTISATQGGFGGAQPTCSGGQFLTCNGTTCSCSTPSGSGGSPGGSHGSVQYFTDAGTFGGASNTWSDGTDIFFKDRSTHATPAATGNTVFYFFDHYGNGPGLPQVASATLNFDTHVDPRVMARSDDAWWGCVLPAAHGSTTYTVTGRAQAGSATGTAAAVSWAATDARTRQVWIQHPAAATTNTNAGYRGNVDYFWRGAGSDQGGFLWSGSFALPLVTATTRVFVGVKDATTVMTAASDPNVTTDTVYFGCNAVDSNLAICSNDNVGTATCNTLGASFPCHTNNAAYDVAIWAASNGGAIGYWIRHLTTGTEATGAVSSDLPRTSVQLGWEFTVNTGGTASAIQIHIGGTCWWSNP